MKKFLLMSMFLCVLFVVGCSWKNDKGQSVTVDEDSITVESDGVAVETDGETVSVTIDMKKE